MHLSYRSVAYQPPSHPLGGRRHSSLLRQGQQLTRQVVQRSAQAIAPGTRSRRQVASTPPHTDMSILLKSSTATRVLDNQALEAQYHSLERSLQLAYAVNNQARIALLESEIERLTGWRFSKGH